MKMSFSTSVTAIIKEEAYILSNRINSLMEKESYDKVSYLMNCLKDLSQNISREILE